MYEILDYSHLKVFLSKTTRSLNIIFNRPQDGNRLNMQMVDEITSLLSWCAKHPEVKSILFSSETPYFSLGSDKRELLDNDFKWLETYFKKCQLIVFSMLHLPQTIIFDLKESTCELGLELSLGADIRLAHEHIKPRWDFLSRGQLPVIGGVTLLSKLIPMSYVQKWILAEQEIECQELLQSGLLHFAYSNDRSLLLERLQQKIHSQSPLARVQAKGLILNQLKELQKDLKTELKFSLGCYFSDDWKQAIKAEQTGHKAIFKDFHQFKQILENMQLDPDSVSMN